MISPSSNFHMRSNSLYQRVPELCDTGMTNVGRNQQYGSIMAQRGVPNGTCLNTSTVDFLKHTIEQEKENRALRNHTNKSHRDEIMAFYELDTKRLQVQKTLQSTRLRPGAEQRRYAEACGIEKDGKTSKELPRLGFHVVMARKIDEKRKKQQKMEEFSSQLRLLKEQGHTDVSLQAKNHGRNNHQRFRTIGTNSGQ